MSFIRNLRKTKFLSFMLILLFAISVAYPLLGEQWNPRAVLNPTGSGDIRVYGQNTETHSFALGDTLSRQVNTPLKHGLDSYLVTVEATGGYGITSYADNDGGSKNQADAKSYTVPSGGGLDNVYKATFTLANGITRIGSPSDSATLNLGVDTDDSQGSFDGVFTNMVDPATNDKLEMSLAAQSISEQQTSVETSVAWHPTGQEVYLEQGEVVTKIEMYCWNGGAAREVIIKLGDSFEGTSIASWQGASPGAWGWLVADVVDTEVPSTGLYYLTIKDAIGSQAQFRRDTTSPSYRGTDYCLMSDATTRRTGEDLSFKIWTQVPNTTGNYISSEINAGGNDLFTTMDISSTLGGATIDVYIDSGGSAFSPVWDTKISGADPLTGGVQDGLDISAEDGQYFRYKIDVTAGGSAALIVDDIDTRYGNLIETLDCSDMDDPAGAEFKSVEIHVDNGDGLHDLVVGDITLGGSWSAWGKAASGTADGGYWTVSGSGIDVDDATLTVTFGGDVNDGDGFDISYENCEVYATCQQYGLQGDDTAGDFATADSVVEAYDGDGMTIVATWTGTDEISPSATVDWDFEETNYAGGDLSTCTYSYDTEFRQRAYKTCQEENMLINGEVPTYLLNGGAELIESNPTSDRPSIEFTGDNPTKYAFDIQIDQLTSKNYDYDEGLRVEINDDDKTVGKVDFTIDNNGGGVRLRSTAITFRLPYRVSEVGVFLQDASDVESGRWLLPITEFTVVYGSTRIKIDRDGYENIIGSDNFNAGVSIRLMITFKTDSDDPYYRYTASEEQIKQGITLGEFEQVGSPIFRESESLYVMQAKLDVPTIWTNYTFDVSKLGSEYIQYCSKAEIVRYEKNSADVRGDYIETFQSSWMTENQIYFGDVKFSPKYWDYIRLTLDMPELLIGKESVDLEIESGRRSGIIINVMLPERPFDVVEPYCQINVGEISALPQRFNYFIYQQIGDDEYKLVEGRLRGYELYWKAHDYTMLKDGSYHWVIMAQEKTLEQKFAVMWSSITKQEIAIGSVVVEYTGDPEYTYPEVEMPEWSLPSWRLPKITLPQYSIKYAAPQIDLSQISSYSSLIIPIVSLVSIMLGITISLYTLNTFKKQEKAQQYMVAQ